MAIDNLNFYSNGLPAGQLTDKYSSQPGCLKSKNLDIFSSSKSVKATAWSAPTTTDNDVVAISDQGDLVLKTDGQVYTRSDGTDTLFINPYTTMPVYNVNYTGEGNTYNAATRGTPQDMVVKYEGDEWKSFVVFTDRASLVYSKTKYVVDKTLTVENLVLDDGVYTNGYQIRKIYPYGNSGYVYLKFNNPGFYNTIPIRIYANQNDSTSANISISSIKVEKCKYRYDPELDEMIPGYESDTTISYSGNIRTSPGIIVNIPCSPTDGTYSVTIAFSFTKKSGASDYGWDNSFLYIDINGGPRENHKMTLLDGTKSDGDYNYYYSYLPLRERKLVPTGEYYWMKGVGFQTLYKWNGSWTTVVQTPEEKKIIYDFIQYMGWESNVSMDIIGMTVWNEQVYMVGNMEGNGYIIPCDLTGSVGTPYIAYGCEFKGITNIDYLMYLVGEDRGVSQLWVYNGQELVSILGGTEEKDSINLIDTTEQYRFDGKMIEYRGDLILGTTDNRIFAYGQTYGGKGGVFIHELPGTITKIVAEDRDLVVYYSITTTSGGVDTVTKYSTTLQDDQPIKNYNTEWEAEYPIVLGNHLLEKEESDLYASYILPSSSCKLEFWGMANHYHFWTFKSAESYNFDKTASYKLKGCTGNYSLKFIEKNGNRYTFRLEGDLPIQTGGWMTITSTSGGELINYTEINHFRKIGEITTAECQEGEFRFHNLNNKLELPKSHSLQIMVRGIGTANYTPELFAVDLVANQRDRG